MPSDTFRPKQKVRIDHVNAVGHTATYDGEVIEHVKDDVWRVTFNGWGLRFLMPESSIHAVEQADAEKV